MIVVIFEAETKAAHKDDYLNAAAVLRPQLDMFDGFISIERFESLSEPGKILSLSFWRDEEAVRNWRNLPSHRAIQAAVLNSSPPVQGSRSSECFDISAKSAYPGNSTLCVVWCLFNN